MSFEQAFQDDNRFEEGVAERHQQIDPLNKSVTYAYDAISRLTGMTNRVGQRQEFAYDGASRLTSEVWKSSANVTVNLETFTYDAVGNLLTAQDGDGKYTMTYDALNRVSTVKEPFAASLTFGYDANSNRTRMEDSFGRIVTSVYDTANRLTSRTTTAGMTAVQATWEYTARDQLATVTYSTGGTVDGRTVRTYDGSGRLTNLTQRDGANAAYSNTTYAYDLADRLTSETTNGGPRTYTYDLTDQLTADSTSTYAYDLNGNRTSGGYATGAANRVSNDGVWTYTYDDEGRRTKKSKGAALETWTYEYDHDGHLTRVEQFASDGGTRLFRVDYTLDAWGNRVARKEYDGSLTLVGEERYAVDGWDTGEAGAENANFNIWADLNSSNALVTRRLYGNGLDEPLTRISAANGVSWSVQDRLGSVTNILNASGTVTATVTYDGFGKVVSNSAPSATDRYGYVGRELDGDTGLMHYRDRELDTGVGRFLSEDRLGFAAGDANLTRYVGNGFPNGTDPSGWEGEPATGSNGMPGNATWSSPTEVGLSRNPRKINPGQTGPVTLPPLVEDENLVGVFVGEVGRGLGRAHDKAVDITAGIIQLGVEVVTDPEAVRQRAINATAKLIEDGIDAGERFVQDPKKFIRETASKARDALEKIADAIEKDPGILIDFGVETLIGIAGEKAIGKLIPGKGSVPDGKGPHTPDAPKTSVPKDHTPDVPKPEAPHPTAPKPDMPEVHPTSTPKPKERIPLQVDGPTCFPAGTRLLTPSGWKSVEAFAPGDLVLSRDQHDRFGRIEAKAVEEVFVRVGHVFSFRAGREEVRTTPEHPFYVEGQGWKEAGRLEVGDQLVSHDGQSVALSEKDAGIREVVTVYNLRVADWHTYFVGGDDWGFSLWAHNADDRYIPTIMNIDGRDVVVILDSETWEPVRFGNFGQGPVRTFDNMKDAERAVEGIRDEAARAAEQVRPVGTERPDLSGTASGGSEHTSGARGSTEAKHQKGQARKAKDYGGEKGDSKRPLPRKPPEGHTGPWPPKE